jgi:hypothetical protein
VSVVASEKRYSTLEREELAQWWRDVQQFARATLAMQGGTRIYVTENIADLSLAEGRYAFVEVHVVSTAVVSPAEFHRYVHTPALRRLIPHARIVSIAPAIDAEISVEA